VKINSTLPDVEPRRCVWRPDVVSPVLAGCGHERVWGLTRFLRGYARTVLLTSDGAASLPVFLYGRGLQMIARRILEGQAETGMLAQVQWTAAHAAAIAEAAVNAMT
jgi:hypothetical protein